MPYDRLYRPSEIHTVTTLDPHLICTLRWEVNHGVRTVAATYDYVHADLGLAISHSALWRALHGYTWKHLDSVSPPVPSTKRFANKPKPAFGWTPPTLPAE